MHRTPGRHNPNYSKTLLDRLSPTNRALVEQYAAAKLAQGRRPSSVQRSIGVLLAVDKATNGKPLDEVTPAELTAVLHEYTRTLSSNFDLPMTIWSTSHSACALVHVDNMFGQIPFTGQAYTELRDSAGAMTRACTAEYLGGVAWIAPQSCQTAHGWRNCPDSSCTYIVRIRAQAPLGIISQDAAGNFGGYVEAH